MVGHGGHLCNRGRPHYSWRVPSAGRRWLVWGLPTFVFMIAFFHRPAPGVIARELMQAFDATGAFIGLVSAAYFWAYAASMIPGGVLIDAYGPRRVVSIGAAVLGLGALLMAVAPTRGVLLTGRGVVGLGATVTFTGALKIAANWFPPSRFGTLSAMTATAGVVGSILATEPLAWLVAAVGWRGALGVVGVATLAGGALCAAVVRDRPREAAAADGPAPSLAAVLSGIGRVLGNRHTWPPFLAFFFMYASWGNLQLWIVPFLRDVYGLPPTDAARAAMATASALLFAAPLTGFLSDRVVGRRKAPYVALTLATFALWLLFVGTLGRLPLAGLVGLFFAMGVVGGAFVLTWPIGREVNPPALAGVAVAVVNLGGFLGAALTQVPLGRALDARWAGALAGGARVYPVDAYRLAFGICAAFALAALAMTLLVRETRGRNIYEELTRGAAAAGRLP